MLWSVNHRSCQGAAAEVEVAKVIGWNEMD